MIDFRIETFLTLCKLKNYTKTDINRMPASELKSLALENGIDCANDMTGADLKKALIEKFNL